MEGQKLAILKALVPIAWADGALASRESAVIERLLTFFKATDADRESLRAYAETRPSVTDIDVVDLSADDRKFVLENAVMMSFVDGEQTRDEVDTINALARHLGIDVDDANRIMRDSEARAVSFAERTPQRRV